MCWLFWKRILTNDGKITKILNALCPAVKLIKDRGGERANILMLRANNCSGVDVVKHYRNLCYRCVPVSFQDFASERLHYNINICRGKKVIKQLFWGWEQTIVLGLMYSNITGIFVTDVFRFLSRILHLSVYIITLTYAEAKRWFTLKTGLKVALSPLVIYWDQMDIFLMKILKQSTLTPLWISCYMKALFAQLDITKLDLDLNSRKKKTKQRKTVILMKHVYGNASEEAVLSTLICIEKWSHNLNIHTDTRMVFRCIIKTTQDTHLRWFQYRLIYRILPSQHLLFLWKLWIQQYIYSVKRKMEL